jgi:Zn finger protein HypA/HybF involved in hydrogenase expression
MTNGKNKKKQQKEVKTIFEVSKKSCLEFFFMKKIEETKFFECDLCWKKVDWVKTCVGCGHTVCIDCLLVEKFMCPVCGGDFHQLIQNR